MLIKLYRLLAALTVITFIFTERLVADDHPNYVRIPLDGMYVTLNPGITADTLSTEIQTQMFIGLTQFDPQSLKALPYLAQKWEASGDLKEYIFYLRDDVKWTDGEPVTAHDVVWAVRHNILPETKSELANFLYVLKNGEKIHKGEIKNITKLGVHVIDNYTVEFKLEHPAIYFPAMAAYTPFWPLPKKTIAMHSEKWSEPENIVTNGPYKLRGVWKEEQVTILVKNPDYFESAKVMIPEIQYIVMKPDKAITMYEYNEIDILGARYLPIPSEEILRIKTDAKLMPEYRREQSLCTYFYGFNNEKAPTDKSLVRKAISAAINRQLIVEEVIKGEDEPAYTFTRPPIFGSVDPDENIGIRFNPERAREWLTQAGYPDGADFPEFSLVYNTSDLHAKIAQSVKDQLQEHLNITITVKHLPYEEYMKMLTTTGDANMFRYGWCADYPDANNWLMEQFHPTKSSNIVRWKNPLFAFLVEKAQIITDAYSRKKLYMKAEHILCEEEAAIAPIFYFTNPVMVKSWLNATIWPLLGNQIRTWSFKDP